MTRPIVVALLAAVVGCSSTPEIGARYRAERDFWKANNQYRQLSIRPELVSDDQWRALASMYEDLAARYADSAAEVAQEAPTPAGRDLRVLVARALMSAARVHTMRGDETSVITLYERIEANFADLPVVSSEVMFAQARIAEGRGNLESAAERYENIVSRVEPAPGEASIKGAVLDLPLHIAQLRNRANEGSPQAFAAYRSAEDRYQQWIAQYPETLIELDSWARLADIAVDQGNPDKAVQILRQLESRLASTDAESRDPAGVRFAIAMLQSSRQDSQDSTRATLLSIVEEYASSPFAPRALLSLANAAAQGDTDPEEALRYLELARSQYGSSELVRAQALLATARVLKRHARWHEARDTYRQLMVEHPVSQEALAAPLEIADHYARAGDKEATVAALASAEESYRDFLTRYPGSPLSLLARQRLVQTWMAQNRNDDAIRGLEELANDTAGTRQGAAFLENALRLATASGDSLKAEELRKRLVALYGDQSRGADTEPVDHQGATAQ